YNDGGATQIASPNLKPESIYSGEVEFSHRFSSTVSASASAFGNVVDGLIVSRGEGTPADPLFYDNSTAPVLTLGDEVEVRRDWRQGWMLSASYSAQHSRYMPSTSFSDIVGSKDSPAFRRVPNAP